MFTHGNALLNFEGAEIQLPTHKCNVKIGKCTQKNFKK